VPVEPGVDSDEDAGAGGEGDAGTPRVLTECVLEELERDRGDQRSGGERDRAAVTALEGAPRTRSAPRGSALEATTANSAALSVSHVRISGAVAPGPMPHSQAAIVLRASRGGMIKGAMRAEQVTDAVAYQGEGPVWSERWAASAG
jgi:hypothetical protein